MSTYPQVYQQETDMQIVSALALQVSHRSFVDVGAEKGSFSKPLLERGFRGVLFEPFPEHLAGLQELVRQYGSQVFPFAIDEADHDGLLHVAVDSEGKPMDYFHSLHRDESHPFAQHAESVPVLCRSLGSLAHEGLVDAAVGILKIDTEGSDLKVIRGMGNFTAEVMLCEFVTPRLYPTWTNSFPEALVAAARERGYEECIAIKRFDAWEVVEHNPRSFVDGQWGNLVFTSSKLLSLASDEIDAMIARCEVALCAAFSDMQRSLEEKEAIIRSLATACEERSGLINQLSSSLEQMRVTEAGLSAKIEQLRAKKI